jgi:hypothetical protein
VHEQAIGIGAGEVPDEAMLSTRRLVVDAGGRRSALPKWLDLVGTRRS